MQTDERPKPHGRHALEEFLSRKDVARLFGVSLSTVTRWARTGWVQAIRTPGGHYRYRAADLNPALPSTAVDVPSPEKGESHERDPRTQ
jgi:excisionase family DNA binding protein